ncbi:MAG TPA: hypothetical protein VG102_03795 [Candidatus Paceibacterota bacterium]|jgi:hypothetical protein|nr:hypothetical protein [Candidatus Paceibacterota bacterium]
MPVKELLGLIAALLSATSGVMYVSTVVRGNTKPHLYTYILWSIVTCLLFAGQFVSGAGAGSWASLVAALATIAVVPLCAKFGTRDITFGDAIALTCGVVTILPWILTKNPLWSVILANLIDMWAIVPTLRKTWNDPSSEPLLPWLLTQAKHILAIAALSSYSITTYLYPVQAFCMNAILICIILFKKRKLYPGPAGVSAIH